MCERALPWVPRMNLGERVRALFRRATPARPPCRLSDADALAIARGALGERLSFIVRGVNQTENGVIWTIVTATIGSGSVVTIDDATGIVLESKSWGVR